MQIKIHDTFDSILTIEFNSRRKLCDMIKDGRDNGTSSSNCHGVLTLFFPITNIDDNQLAY